MGDLLFLKGTLAAYMEERIKAALDGKPKPVPLGVFHSAQKFVKIINNGMKERRGYHVPNSNLLESINAQALFSDFYLAKHPGASLEEVERAAENLATVVDNLQTLQIPSGKQTADYQTAYDFFQLLGIEADTASLDRHYSGKPSRYSWSG